MNFTRCFACRCAVILRRKRGRCVVVCLELLLFVNFCKSAKVAVFTRSGSLMQYRRRLKVLDGAIYVSVVLRR